jgi:spoIIIJ-associated protein
MNPPKATPPSATEPIREDLAAVSETVSERAVDSPDIESTTDADASVETDIDLEDENDDDGDEPTEREGSSLLIQEGDVAADYLERLLDIVDYDGDIDLDVENDRAVVAIIGNGLQSLVGTRGETLDALQELTRLAVAQKTGTRSRLMLDISGHRQARRSELSGLATDTAARVLDSGEPARLAPMNPFERKVVHDAVAGIAGVRSESEGEEPNRRVVVLPGD